MSMNVGDKKSLNADINITPFADVCLVLLIIFMVVTPLLQKGVPVNLPNARNPEAQPEKESNINISLQEDGKLWYGAKWIPGDVLQENLQEDYARNPGRDVYIKADKRVEFVYVKDVLRTVQSVGFKGVGLVAQHVDEKGNPVTGNAAGAVASGTAGKS
ncbi:MAG: biopolymer transporter ExbD [Acidobacteriota bacterium]|jgi:biopolymer transport protein ExbD